MSAVTDISHPTGLKPRVKYFEEVGDTCINVDGCIEIMRQTDTPQAKSIWFAFRKRLAALRTSMHGTDPEKIREEAFFQALADVGINTTLTPINGSMD